MGPDDLESLVDRRAVAVCKDEPLPSCIPVVCVQGQVPYVKQQDVE
jgi:hypothetical protein